MLRSGMSPTSPATCSPGFSPGVRCGGRDISKAFARRFDRRFCPAPGGSRSTSTSPPASRPFGGQQVGSALCRIASSLADSAQRPADLLGRAFYPEVIRLDFTTKKPWKLMLRVMVFASIIAVVAIGLLLIGG